MSSMPSSVSESGVSPFAGLPASLWWGAALAGALFGVGEGRQAAAGKARADLGEVHFAHEATPV